MTLELGRGVAAVLVALFHVSGMAANYLGQLPFGFAFRGGHAGVEYFFVLSGFIIFYIHHLDLGREERLAGFAVKRVVRIVPMYWLVLTLIGAALLANASWGAEKELTLGRVALDYLLVPREGALLLPPAWTLQREFLFYLCFGVMIWRFGFGCALFIAWQGAMAIMLGIKFAQHQGFGYLGEYFFGYNNLGFPIGILACWMFLREKRLPPNIEYLSVAVGVCGFLGTMFAEWYLDVARNPAVLEFLKRNPVPYDQEIVRSIAYSVSAGLLIFGLALWEFRQGPRFARAAVYFGGASYLVYLLHMPLASLLLKLIRKADSYGFAIGAGSALVLVVLSTLAASVVAHVVLERPITSYLRKKVM